MIIALLFVAALALAGSVDATICTCSVLGADNSKQCWLGRHKSACYCDAMPAECYRLIKDKTVSGHPIKPAKGAPGHLSGSCYLVYGSTAATINSIGAACVEGECEGFTVGVEGRTGLKVCYYAKVEEHALPSFHHDDDRCMGVWVRLDKCKKPPTPEYTDPTCDAVKHAYHVAHYATAEAKCHQTYGTHAPNAVHKCLDCLKLGLANNGICFTCPAYSNDAAVQCLDCIWSAKDEPAKRKCPCCEHYYGYYKDDAHTGGSTMRCYDCIRSLNVDPKHATAMNYASVAGQCLDFCRLYPTKQHPGMTTATQCLNCVAHVGAGCFSQLVHNLNGECNPTPQCLNPQPTLS